MMVIKEGGEREGCVGPCVPAWMQVWRPLCACLCERQITEVERGC